MLIFPVILIFVMGKALNGLMSLDKNIFCGKTIYYNIEKDGGENNNVQVFYDFITEFQKNSDVKFVQSNDVKKVTSLVNKDEAICFINIRGDDIDYFRNENKESTEKNRKDPGKDLTCQLKLCQFFSFFVFHLPAKYLSMIDSANRFRFLIEGEDMSFLFLCRKRILFLIERMVLQSNDIFFPLCFSKERNLTKRAFFFYRLFSFFDNSLLFRLILFQTIIVKMIGQPIIIGNLIDFLFFIRKKILRILISRGNDFL